MREYMEEIEEATEEIMGRIFEQPSWDIESSSLEPLFNISVKPDEVVVTADLPCVDKETIKIDALDEDLIEISAKMKVRLRFEDFGVSYREGEFSCFRCQVPLPVPVDTSRAKATFKRGILVVTLPRKKGYRIKVE